MEGGSNSSSSSEGKQKPGVWETLWSEGFWRTVWNTSVFDLPACFSQSVAMGVICGTAIGAQTYRVFSSGSLVKARRRGLDFGICSALGISVIGYFSCRYQEDETRRKFRDLLRSKNHPPPSL